MRIAESELIINPDGSVYHLQLKPGELANTVIFVGDPDRVDLVSGYFDEIELKREHREFKTHTGTYNGKRISVISTGIGIDNIDIVLNEIDALVNINFETREINSELVSLDIIRIGTSGSVQEYIHTDSIVISEAAIGFDNLFHFYANNSFMDLDFAEQFSKHTNWSKNKSKPYAAHADKDLLESLSTKEFYKGVTVTNIGFYGPQGRSLRLELADASLNDKITSFELNGKKIVNFEMETAAIYGMSKLLGHRAISFNAILANRISLTFSENPLEAIHTLTKYVLDKVSR